MIIRTESDVIWISEIARILVIDHSGLEALRRHLKLGKLEPYWVYICGRLCDYPQQSTRSLLQEIERRGHMYKTQLFGPTSRQIVAIISLSKMKIL